MRLATIHSLLWLLLALATLLGLVAAAVRMTFTDDELEEESWQ
jgi:hypothetical protein